MIHYIDLSSINDKIFFMNKEVIIVKIIRSFNLVKVKYVNSNSIFVVDIHALSKEPNMTQTISIGILGGGSK